jgi:hypothetical protein
MKLFRCCSHTSESKLLFQQNFRFGLSSRCNLRIVTAAILNEMFLSESAPPAISHPHSPPWESSVWPEHLLLLSYSSRLPYTNNVSAE